jgi:hypothetical protein
VTTDVLSSVVNQNVLLVLCSFGVSHTKFLFNIAVVSHELIVQGVSFHYYSLINTANYFLLK